MKHIHHDQLQLSLIQYHPLLHLQQHQQKQLLHVHQHYELYFNEVPLVLLQLSLIQHHPLLHLQQQQQQPQQQLKQLQQVNQHNELYFNEVHMEHLTPLPNTAIPCTTPSIFRFTTTATTQLKQLQQVNQHISYDYYWNLGLNMKRNIKYILFTWTIFFSAALGVIKIGHLVGQKQFKLTAHINNYIIRDSPKCETITNEINEKNDSICDIENLFTFLYSDHASNKEHLKTLRNIKFETIIGLIAAISCVNFITSLINIFNGQIIFEQKPNTFARGTIGVAVGKGCVWK